MTKFWPRKSGSTPSTSRRWVYLGVAALMIILAFALISATYRNLVASQERMPGPEIMLPIMLIVSILVLLIAMAAIAVLFAFVQLDDRSQPLGLPAGSIQSLIALSLIMIFMISAVYLFASLRSPPVITSKSIGVDQMAQFSTRIVTVRLAQAGPPPLYDVDLRDDTNQAAVDMAKQIMTMIGTLLVTVIGFYFGTRAAAAGASATALQPAATGPSIKSIAPDHSPNGPGQSAVQVVVTGANFTNPTRFELRLVSAGHSVAGTVTSQSALQLTATLNLTGMRSGKWTPVVINPDGSEALLPEGFEVTT
ncbi:MAG: hypothetical protein U0768_12035 [Anaerolineae bacterium]